MTSETFEFTMKDQSGSFDWMFEGGTTISDLESVGAGNWIEETAKMMISGANYGDTTDEEVYQAWLDNTDERDEMETLIEAKIEEMKDEKALDVVMTTKEVADVYGIKEDTVRDAIEHEWLIARKSGGTWLILRKHAEKRWKKEPAKQ